MVLNVNRFKDKLRGGTRANLFKVTLRTPAGLTPLEELSPFVVKTAEVPGSTISPIIVPFRGRQLKISGDKTFDPWTVQVLNDPDFTVRKAMEIWMSGMNNHEDNQGVNDGYFVDLEIAQLDREGTPLRTYVLKDAWPSDLGPMQASFDAENTLQEFPITFQYQYWTSGLTNTDVDLIEDGAGFGG